MKNSLLWEFIASILFVILLVKNNVLFTTENLILVIGIISAYKTAKGE